MKSLNSVANARLGRTSTKYATLSTNYAVLTSHRLIFFENSVELTFLGL